MAVLLLRQKKPSILIGDWRFDKDEGRYRLDLKTGQNTKV